MKRLTHFIVIHRFKRTELFLPYFYNNLWVSRWATEMFFPVWVGNWSSCSLLKDTPSSFSRGQGHACHNTFHEKTKVFKKKETLNWRWLRSRNFWVWPEEQKRSAPLLRSSDWFSSLCGFRLTTWNQTSIVLFTEADHQLVRRSAPRLVRLRVQPSYRRHEPTRAGDGFGKTITWHFPFINSWKWFGGGILLFPSSWLAE